MLTDLDHDRELVVQTVREFVERDVMPVASDLEHRGEYPHALVETMKTLGLFGLNVPEEYGGTPVDYTTFAMIFEELTRGWMALAGIIGSHLVLCDVLGLESPTPRQPDRRGAHVAITHPRAAELVAASLARKVVTDHRSPDIVRIGCSPLTTRFVDVHDGVTRVAEAISSLAC